MILFYNESRERIIQHLNNQPSFDKWAAAAKGRSFLESYELLYCQIGLPCHELIVATDWDANWDGIRECSARSLIIGLGIASYRNVQTNKQTCVTWAREVITDMCPPHAVSTMDMSSVRHLNLSLYFFRFKCCVSQLSVDRFGKKF